MNWQPIETAPKGGGADDSRDPRYVEPPRILLRFGDEAVSIAYWEAYFAPGGRGCTDGFAWTEPCSGEPLNLHYTTPPTHWMSMLAVDADAARYRWLRGGDGKSTRYRPVASGVFRRAERMGANAARAHGRSH